MLWYINIFTSTFLQLRINNTDVLVLFKTIYQRFRKTITSADIKDQDKTTLKTLLMLYVPDPFDMDGTA